MRTLSEKIKLQEIQKNRTIPFASSGEFSMHELLEHLLETTGPATVRISSFSVSEVAIRSFFRLVDKKKILQLDCLFDMSVKRHKLGLLNFANNVAGKIALTKNHAKLILIENDKWQLAVAGSANFQLNDKNEAGFITTVQDHYRFFSDVFTGWFSNGILVTADEFN